MSAPHNIYSPLFSTDPEAHAGAEVCPERGIADHFLIMAVERVLDVGIGADAFGDGEPAAEIHANVAGGVINVESEEVIVGTASDKAAAEIGSPAIADVAEQRGRGMFGTAQQRHARGVN